MEHDLVFGASAIVGVLAGIWGFGRAPKKLFPSVTSKAKTGYFYLAIFCIGAGLVNLFYGFLAGHIFVSWKYGGYGWVSYEDHKRIFALYGFMSAFSIFMGIDIVKLVLRSKTEQ